MTTKDSILEAWKEDLKRLQSKPKISTLPRVPVRHGLTRVFKSTSGPALVVKAWIQGHQVDYLPPSAEHLLLKHSLLIYSSGYDDEEIDDLTDLATGLLDPEAYTNVLFDYLQAIGPETQAILQGSNYGATEDYFRFIIVEHLFDEFFPRSGLDVETEHHVPSAEILKLFDLPYNWTPRYATGWSYWNFGFIHEGFKPKANGFELKEGRSKLPQTRRRTRVPTRRGELFVKEPRTLKRPPTGGCPARRENQDPPRAAAESGSGLFTETESDIPEGTVPRTKDCRRIGPGKAAVKEEEEEQGSEEEWRSI